MRYRFCGAGAVLLMVFLSQSAVGRNPPSAQAGPSAPTKSNYSTSPIDSKADALPPDFKGHDLESLFKRIFEMKAHQGKGEFETTTQYEQRIQNEAAKALLGSLTLTSTFGFVVDGPDVRYDADNKILAVTQTIDEYPHNAAYRILPFKLETASLGSYIATNGFGTSFEVQRSHTDLYRIAVTNSNDFRTQRGGFTARISIAPEEAKAARESVGVLAVCLLSPPYATSNRDYHEATLSSSVDFDIDTKYLYVKVLAIWVCDFRSGKIFSKIVPLAVP